MKKLTKIKIAIVEDDVYYNKTLTRYIQNICNEQVYKGHIFEIKSFYNAHDCIEELEDDLNIMILDYFLFNEDEDDVLTGGDVLDVVKEHCPDCKVIVASAQQSAHTTAELLRNGVFEYIDKNVNTSNRIGAILQKVIA
ncbi:MAG: response regulator of citrate/malate metabolism [Flavobacteriales bacterium]|jgi:response regulator of citrate/malate metabolism